MKSLNKIKLDPTSSNIMQQLSNMVFIRTQHVGHNNVGWCWSNMLHPFKQALMIVNVWYCSKHKNILPATELIHTISDMYKIYNAKNCKYVIYMLKIELWFLYKF